MTIAKKNPTVEQEICIKCGMCCDGTLFNVATVEKGEKEFLPTLLQKRHIVTENGERFKQPCPYFNDKCTIYHQKKPQICSSFRCQVLKDLSKGKINEIKAKEIVKNAIDLRNEIFKIYLSINKSNTIPSFREIHFELRKKKKENISKNIIDKPLNLLLVKCDIFEILLIKHFQSSKKFESLMV